MNKIVKYKEYIISISIFLFLCLLLYNKVLFSSYEFLPPDSYSAKAVEQGFELSEKEYGEYPTWLPWMFSGLPSVHSFQHILDHYYPYKIFKIFRDFGVLRFYEFILHLIFAGLGMLLLLKKMKCNFIPSMFGAVSYMSMPYLTANLIHGHGSLVMTACYIPWIMWALMNLINKSNLLSLGIFGLLIGLQLQRGHVQIAYYTWMMFGLYILFHITKYVYNIIVNNIFINRINLWLFLPFSLFLGIGLAASIYLPAISYADYSTRGSMELNQAVGWSFPPIESIVFLLPSFFGFGGYTYWGQIEFTDYPQYMGVIVLIFSIYACCFSSNKIKLFLISTLFFSLFIAFGRYFQDFYSIFYNYFPFFNKFRVPMYILILFQFSVCTLAGIGLNDYIYNVNRKKTYDIFKIITFIFSLTTIIFLFKSQLINFEIRNIKYYGLSNHQILDPIRIDLIYQGFYLFLFLICTLTLLILYNKFSLKHKVAIGCGIMILSLLDVFIVNYKIINPNQSQYRLSPLLNKEYLDAYLREDEIINFLLKDDSKYRIWPIQELERSNRWSAFNIESVSGYHPAKLSSYNDIIKSTGFMMPGIMKTLNIKYIISLHKLPEDQIPKYLELVFSGSIYLEANKEYGIGYVYRYNDYYDRLYFSKEVKVLTKDEQIKKLNNNYFDPKEISMLPESINEEIQYDQNAHVELIDWSPNKIIFKTLVESKQFLNISEVFYPQGWTVNDSVEIFKVNNLIRGIVVDSGENIYTMEYKPGELRWGKIISFTSFLILLLLILLGIKNEYKK